MDSKHLVQNLIYEYIHINIIEIKIHNFSITPGSYTVLLFSEYSPSHKYHFDFYQVLRIYCCIYDYPKPCGSK